MGLKLTEQRGQTLKQNVSVVFLTVTVSFPLNICIIVYQLTSDYYMLFWCLMHITVRLICI